MNTHSIILPFVGSLSGTGVQYSPLDILPQLAATIACFILLVSTILGCVFLIHFLFTLPMRRAERARLFLDLLEGALDRGQAVEEMILSVAQSRDRTVGIDFHVLAAHIENGLNFTESLQKVPRIFPPQILAILAAGQKLGDLKKVLPAGREILRDRPESVRSAMHYLVLAVLVFSPAFIFVTLYTTTFVIPKFRDVAAAMGVKLWPETVFVFAHTNWLLALEITVSLLIGLCVLSYIAGPRLTRWLKVGQIPIQDWLAWRISWKRKRLLRTFSAMLSVLLDGGVPEAEAVSLAGACTANEICRRRSQRILVALENGAKLDEAVRRFDDSGEFHWRMSNAAHGRGGFLPALRGWHQALDAKAFQQEEATAHLVTSGVAILNGALVVIIATAMFGILIAVLNHTLATL
jgi:type II secretory pathway component PulF